jgi:hypothetical protein
MMKLFDLRRIFLGIASRALNRGAGSSTVVSWVDVVLAKLGDAVMVSSTGFHRECLLASIPQTLKRKRDEDGLWAASQLPGMFNWSRRWLDSVSLDKWQLVPSVLSSDHASPAAKRLALRLTFAVYIMGPEFTEYDPWSVAR